MNPISDQDIDGLAKNYRSDFQPDVEAGLARLKGRMTSKAAIRPLRPRRWLGIAASLLVLVAAGSFAFQAFFGSTTVRNDDPSPMHFALADGTEIWLQEDSEIRYDRSFNESDRKVSLRGQAYFDVHSDPSRPFLVNSGNAELRVTGTTFNLRVERGEMEVEVSEGSVMLMGKSETTGVAVGQKESGMVMPDGTVKHMDAPSLNRHAWRTGTLTFTETPLGEVLESVRNNFRVEIMVDGIDDFPITGTFGAENAEEILVAIAKLAEGELARPTNESQAFRLFSK